MGDVVHLFRPAEPIPCTAATAITGGQLVYVSGSPRQVSPTTASTGAAIGQAAFDAAAGDKVTVLRGGVQKYTAAAAITAGDLVIPAASGQVTPLAAGNAAHVVGKALTSAASGALVEIAASF